MPSLKKRGAPQSETAVHNAQDLVDLVEFVGWPLRRNGGAVYVIFPPPPRAGEAAPSAISMAVTTGDHRAFINAKKRLARAGLFKAADARYEALDRAARRKTMVAQQRSEQVIASINYTPGVDERTDDVARKKLQELVDRCQRVGWETKQVGVEGANYLVTPPGKRVITIYMNNSVRSYPDTVESSLIRAGLLEAEKQLPGNQEIGEGVGDPPGGYSQVDGMEIAEWTFARTPGGGKDRLALEMLLEDGSVVVGCAACQHVTKTWQGNIQHRGRMHPELLSPESKAKAARKAAELKALAEAAAAEAQQRGPRGGESRPALGMSPAPATMVMPLFSSAAPPTPQERLRQILTSPRSTSSTPAPAPEPAPAPAAPAAAPAAPAAPAPEPAPEPAAETAPAPELNEPAAAPVGSTPNWSRMATPVGSTPAPAPAPPADVAADVESQDPPQPRRVESSPIVRAQISAVAATVRTPDAGALTDGPVDLPTLVRRVQALKGAVEEAERLRAENAALTDKVDTLARQVDELTKQVNTKTAQGTALAEQCIQKDALIRRLRNQIEADAENVKAAAQLQKLMGGLLNG